MHIFMNFKGDINLQDKITNPYFIQVDFIILLLSIFKEESSEYFYANANYSHKVQKLYHLNNMSFAEKNINYEDGFKITYNSIMI